MGYYSFNYRDELYHHGVLGMHWGVRRYQSYAENPKLSDRKQRKYEKNRQKALNAKNAKELYKRRQYLSTEELKEKSERFVLEKQLKDISEGDTSVGKKIATDTMVEVGKTLITVAAIAGVAYAASKTPTGKEIIKNAKAVYSVVKKTADVAAAKADVAKDVTKKVAEAVSNPSKVASDIQKAAANTGAAKAYVNTINNTVDTLKDIRHDAAKSEAGKAYVETVTKVINTEPAKAIRREARNTRRAAANTGAAKAYVNAMNKIIKR